MNKAQKTFGEPSARARGKVLDYMTPRVQEFITHSPFLVMASSNKDGQCDASPKGGVPGFVKVIDEKLLVLPDVAGNRLFQSYENFETNPHVGLIFFIPSVDTTVRVNGKVKVLEKGAPAFDKLRLSVFNPDENASLLQAILVEVLESYSQCSRALAFSKLWDVDTLLHNRNESPI